MKKYETRIGNDIDTAADFLEKETLVAIPTETVYGLAANAFSEKAIRQLYTVKNRPLSNPLIVHVDRISEVKALVREMPEAAELLLEHFTPGPLTVLLPKNSLVPPIVNAGRPELAIRIPSHPIALELLRRLDFPLAAPSANRFGTISPTQPEHVLKNFDGQIPYILDGGACTVGIESTVVGFDRNGRPMIYRPGAITAAQIEAVAGRVSMTARPSGTPSPGLLPFHYAPSTPLLLVENIDEALRLHEGKRVGVLSFTRSLPQVPQQYQFRLSEDGTLSAAARNLYKALHWLDEAGTELILAERLPDQGLGTVLNERLQKAANYHLLTTNNRERGAVA
jgi:L-threonylcarbamoyladenylate synthase